LCAKEHYEIDQLLTNADLQDLKGNFNLKVAKLLTIQNNKGMTPLT
jgi:hypothetical protein